MNDWLRYEMRHHPEIDEKFHQLNLGNIANVIYWDEFFQLIRRVPGDLVECGVGRGRSFVILAALNTLFGSEEGGGRRMFAYDSFSGFPEPSPEDQSARNPKAGEWANSPSGKYRYTPEFLRLVLSSAGVEPPPLGRGGFEVIVHSGYFNQSLPEHPQRPIALLHLDGDLYQSYKDCLKHLYPLVNPGGVVVFDDFLLQESPQEKFPGARRAAKEFLGAAYADLRCSRRGNPYYIKPG